jgi:hypothetical protein
LQPADAQEYSTLCDFPDDDVPTFDQHFAVKGVKVLCSNIANEEAAGFYQMST